MRFVRFTTREDPVPRFGIQEGATIEAVTGPPWGNWSRTGRTVPYSRARLVAPAGDGVIVGIGKNFVAEGADVPPEPPIPILFFKPRSSVVGPGAEIVLPPGIESVTFEAELAVVIGVPGRAVQRSRALEHVCGYTVANDVAATQFHHPEGHWTVSKAFDTFCPLGPAIVTELDLDRVEVEGTVDGERRQLAGLDRMIIGVREMISYVSGFMTLSPGDVLLTGTPAGAGPVRARQLVDCSVTGIGTLRNRVVGTM